MNTNSFKSEIESLVEERQAKYKTTDNSFDCEEITATFNREKETVNGYNGRQLLELIQNADDANSEEILIELDTEKHILTIANKGEDCEGFSIAGVKSLLLANLSSKTSNEYIGNKGLGFRSIINWSDKITINSNNLDIAFSKGIAVEAFDGSDLEHSKLPILAIPEIKDNQQDNWKTKITLEYKEKFLDDIKKQIEQIKPEILLFLNHLENITLIIDEEENDHNKPDLWTIESKNGDIPSDLLTEDDEDAKYELKIAFNESLTNNGFEYLFSYFPTNIKISMPFIVHGTFDLDSTRNQLNDTEKNKFVLGELVKLIINTAKNLTAGTANYKALEFLNYSHKNEVLEKLDFYEKIDLAIEELEIYPYLGGDYRKKEDILYSNDFSKFVNTDDYRELFPYLLIPADSEKIIDILNDQKLDGFSYYNNQIEDLKSLNEKISNIDDRVEFIHLLIKNDFQGRLSLLVDSDNELIFENEVYTPSNHEFSLPDFVKIKFINQELFDKLIEKFEVIGEKARELQKILKDITNIHSYEPAQVLQKIITQSNLEAKNNPEIVEKIIKSMVQSLYKNYLNFGNLNISPDTKIQLLNENNALSDAKDLYLSESYPSGGLTNFLFVDVFSKGEFLAGVSVFDFSVDGDKNKIEDFFISLGVSKNTKFYDAKDDNENYTNFVFTKINKPENYRNNYLTIKGILNFEKIIEKLSLEKIVLWILSNEYTNNQLNDSNNLDIFEYEKNGQRYNDWNQSQLTTKPSFIKFQFNKSEIFKDYLLGNDNLNNLINDKNFNFEDEIFTKFTSFNKADIESVMLKIGAVDRFNNLSIQAVERIVKELPNKSENGKQSQSIYKLCIKHFEKNNIRLSIDDYQLFSKKNGVEGYVSYEDVFYNGNIKLPKKITEEKAIFNHPRRQSTTKVIDFFGVKNLALIEIKITKNNKSDIQTEEFNQLFTNIKPYILAYRIDDIEAVSSKKNELSKLKNIKIKLCEEVEYTVDNKPYSLEVNDYIKDTNGNYLIKIDSNIAFKKAKNSFEFQESFADIIGLAFDILDIKVFRNMLEKDTDYIEKTIQNDIGNDAVINAKELLGISDEFNSFWMAIYKVKNLKYSDKLKDSLPQIQEELGFSQIYNDIDYANLSSMKTCENIILLFNELTITIQDFNNWAYYKIDFSKYHEDKLANYFNDNQRDFEQNLYDYCNKGTRRSDFINLKNRYKGSYDQDDFKEVLEVDYQSICEEFIKKEFEFKLSKTQ
ncbi:sacsin N-terminal ATP-binding-like domain-containing protein, partial [Bathymodiolus thermophilus thioautotrophic gill symbiont]